jgi:hypothetical protein
MGLEQALAGALERGGTTVTRERQSPSNAGLLYDFSFKEKS